MGMQADEKAAWEELYLLLSNFYNYGFCCNSTNNVT